MKTIIIYDTKHGNTKQVAELIGDGLNSVEENIITFRNVEDFDPNKEEVYDLIIIGTPNHYGKPTKPIKKFIQDLPKSSLKVNSFTVFDTYMFKDYEKVVKKMEKRISKLIPSLNRVSSGLSIRVAATKGPILDDELPKCKDFGIKLAK
ncbi:MAG: flavodoxin family protein [Candidatus Lokiarchaeota archaeon]|nr:flavodoxin family protein [Candidatus Lokiarchaeota archaeon]